MYLAIERQPKEMKQQKSVLDRIDLIMFRYCFHIENECAFFCFVWSLKWYQSLRWYGVRYRTACLTTFKIIILGWWLSPIEFVCVCIRDGSQPHSTTRISSHQIHVIIFYRKYWTQFIFIHRKPPSWRNITNVPYGSALYITPWFVLLDFECSDFIFVISRSLP